MSDPFALTRPDGSIHAYACGRCGKVGAGGSSCLGPDPVTGFYSVDPDDSRRDAERCCNCVTCGARQEAPGGAWCAACDAKMIAKRAAETAQALALQPVAAPPVDDVEAIYDVVMEGGVRLEVFIVDDHATFYEGRCAYRDAEHPEHNRDFTEGLQRNPMSSLTSVLFSVAYYLQADIVSVTRRPL